MTSDDFSDILEQCYAPEVVPDPYQLQYEQNHKAYLKMVEEGRKQTVETRP